jgi:hypothetical protein
MHTSYILLLINIYTFYANLTSYTDFSYIAKYFIPANPAELRGIHSSIDSVTDCAILCNEDSRCRTLLSDPPLYRLYEGFSNSGSISSPSSANSIVGAINYDYINLASAYFIYFLEWSEQMSQYAFCKFTINLSERWLVSSRYESYLSMWNLSMSFTNLLEQYNMYTTTSFGSSM